jgi:hypothetical protein
MVSVEVLGSTAANAAPFSELAALGGAMVLAISIIVLLKHRSSH